MSVTLFEAVGGADAVLAVAQAWNRRCLADPVVSHPFTHDDLHPEHVERLAAYWSEALGGPPVYSTSMGDHAEVMRMHACNGPHRELDERAVRLFELALEDAAVPVEARASLAAYFRTMTEQMAAYDETTAPAQTAPVPRWSWDGPVT